MTSNRNQMILLMGMLAAAMSVQGQGVVSGVLSDDKSKAYADGARVLVVRVAERPEGFEPFVSNAVTAKDGSYRITSSFQMFA